MFEGRFRITQGTDGDTAKDFVGHSAAAKYQIGGELRYQACDKRFVTLRSVPVKWQLNVLPLDRHELPKPSSIR